MGSLSCYVKGCGTKNCRLVDVSVVLKNHRNHAFTAPLSCKVNDINATCGVTPPSRAVLPDDCTHSLHVIDVDHLAHLAEYLLPLGLRGGVRRPRQTQPKRSRDELLKVNVAAGVSIQPHHHDPRPLLREGVPQRAHQPPQLFGFDLPALVIVALVKLGLVQLEVLGGDDLQRPLGTFDLDGGGADAKVGEWALVGESQAFLSTRESNVRQPSRVAPPLVDVGVLLEVLLLLARSHVPCQVV
mmetsp:Transcript_8621/g.21158  ORF Transcript_8621/g.21158 Transcript_8621/m.21158 type:complete len:242 (-) Transcript_8621:137-862(-)